MSSDSNPWQLTWMKPVRVLEKDGNSPAYVSDECEYMYRRSQICRDLRGGFPEMMAKADTYLPRYESEPQPDYEERLKFSSFRNYYSQAAGTILGKLFSTPPKLNEDVPEQIKKDLNDADLNGNEWTISAEELMAAAIDEGLAWLLIDYQTVENAKDLTLAQEQALGVRPYWVVVPQSQVLGVRYSQVNNVYVISQFRFVTSVMVDDGDFGQKCVEQIRVVEPDRYRTYEKDDQGTWVVKGDTPNTLGMVPLCHLALDKRGTFRSLPPLENLAYMNVEHFQIRSDQRRALAVASFPILAIFGVEKTAPSIRIGPMTSISLEDAKGKIEWVESQGIHLLAGDRELTKLELQMRTFGLSFENPGMYATATGRNIDASDAIAPIQRWAYRLRDCLNSALWYMAQWRKMAEGGTVNVNTAFIKNQISVEELKLLVEALKAGAITKESFLLRMQDYGILSVEFDASKEVDELEKMAEKALAEQIAVTEAAAKAKANDPPDGEGEAEDA